MVRSRILLDPASDQVSPLLRSEVHFFRFFVHCAQASLTPLRTSMHLRYPLHLLGSLSALTLCAQLACADKKATPEEVPAPGTTSDDESEAPGVTPSGSPVSPTQVTPTQVTPTQVSPGPSGSGAVAPVNPSTVPDNSTPPADSTADDTQSDTGDDTRADDTNTSADDTVTTSPGTGEDTTNDTSDDTSVPTDSEDAAVGAPSRTVVYVGGYDYGGNDYPFQIYDFDRATGTLTAREETVDAGANPSYIAVGTNNLYVANERDDQLGGLTALRIESDGALTPLNHQPGSDGGFTYVAVDPSHRFAFGASYNGGSISRFPIEDDGSLGAEAQVVDFGPNAQSHALGFDTSGQYVFVPNKGNDEVAQLSFGSDGTLSANDPPSVATADGAGPRHIAVSPDGAFAWVINELANSLTTFQVAQNGTLTAGGTVSSLPPGYGGGGTGAHVEITANGRWLYASNRGHDSIAVFAIDGASGALTLLEHEDSGGSTPRDFDVDPQDNFVIVANQDSGTVVVLAIQEDGTLQPVSNVPGPPSPAAVQILDLP